MGARRIVPRQKGPKQQKAPRKLQLSLPRPQWLSRRLLGGVMLLVVAGSVLVSGGWWLSQPTTLPIERVQVEGEFRYLAREDIYAALGELASGGFFNVDVRAVKQAAESLPWVDRASVRRMWPDTLQVEITEQVPLARWGKDQVVNARGEVFTPPLQVLPVDLPVFSGPQDTAQMVAAKYQALSAQLTSVGLKIAALSLSQRRAWQLRLANGLQLLLGRAGNDAQLQRFVTVYPRVLGEKLAQMQSVDLRYTNGFAVRWKAAAAQQG
jgi:cell division protein FtsQ